MRLKGEVKLTLDHAESSSCSEDDTTQSVFVSIDAMRLNSTAEKYHHFVFLFKSRHSLVLRSASSSFAIRSCAPAHLAVWLRDVGYGVAYFQTCPVDGPCHSKQSEEDQQRPRNVDSFGVLGRLPRADLAERKRCGTQKMVGTCREIFTHTDADTHTHHKSCSGGYKDNEEQEAQQAPLPGVRPANGGAGHKQQKYSDTQSRSLRFLDTGRGKGAYTFRQCGHRANVLSEISVHWKKKKGARANMQPFYTLCQSHSTWTNSSELWARLPPGIRWNSDHRWPGCPRADAAAQDSPCWRELDPGWWCVCWE